MVMAGSSSGLVVGFWDVEDTSGGLSPRGDPPPSVSGLADAAGREELLAGQPAGGVRGQEHGNRGDVAGLAGAAERGLLDRFLLEGRADEPAAHRPLRL